MRSFQGFAFLAFLLVPTLCAQQGAGGDKDRIQKEIEQRRKQMREGSTVSVSVRVTIRLKNQNKLTGVVKNGRFVERSEGLEFVEADRKSPGAGIRVWYYDGTTSCIFLPYEEIESYTIGARLTEAQVKAIEERLEQEKKRAEEAREASKRRRDEEQKKAEGGETGGEDKQEKPKETGVKSSEKLSAKDKELLALVEEFPPEKGWSPEKAAEIEKRKTTLRVFPSATEKRFLLVLADWKLGVALKKELEPKPEAKGEPKAEARTEPKKAAPAK